MGLLALKEKSGKGLVPTRNPPPEKKGPTQETPRDRVLGAVRQVREVFPGAEVLSPEDIRREVAKWSENKREAFEERAAIVQFDAGETKEGAEQLAFSWLGKTKA